MRIYADSFLVFKDGREEAEKIPENNAGIYGCDGSIQGSFSCICS